MKQQVLRFEREVYPAPPQPYPPVPGAIKKLTVEKRFDIAENLRLSRRVKAMAAVIDRYPLKLEAAGIPAHVIALL